jgi:hypothetical protein
MNDLQKYLSKSLLAAAALLVGASPAFAAAAVPSLGAASGFTVLGGTVTCTTSVVTGDVGSTGAFTNTGPCTITGGMPPATNTAAATAYSNFLSAYTTLGSPVSTPCDTFLTTFPTAPLSPGVYCFNSFVASAGGVLTLDGPANGIWIFKIGTSGAGYLEGTNFSVLMTGGGQPCNVTWWVADYATMTTSALKGNILAGKYITLTGGTLAGRALAKAAVTMTGASVIGCDVLSGSPPSSCKDKDRDGNDKDHGKCDDGHKGDKGQGKCDDGKDGDKGHESDSRYPFESKHDDGGKGGKK